MNFDTKSPVGLEYGRKDAGGGGDDTAGMVSRELQRIGGEVKTAMTTAKDRITEHGDRLADIEQRLARRGAPGTPEVKTWGRSLTESDGFKALAGSSSQQGKARVQVEAKNLGTKAITSAGPSGGALIAPDHRVTDPVMLQRRVPTIRALVSPGETVSNLVTYVLQSTRTINAAMVAEGGQKPYSDATFDTVQAPVRTLAHLMKASRQAMDDAPALASMIDAEMQYGLADAEDRQMLIGDGTGQNLLGMIPQASAYAFPASMAPIGNMTQLDVLLVAQAQLAAKLYEADGIVLHPIDWFTMLAIKDTQGRYIGAGPFGDEDLRRLWSLPVVITTQIAQNRFLIGNFKRAAQIFDRMDAEILLSTENADDFEKNMITVRGEKRLAFTVPRPDALVTGTFPTAGQ
ncbi:phage capsid protein [Methylorubrum extorquens]|uniref:phage major capsid protein n=1 Tax=Methylorubrum extorquens TaxID=408 RepID=UPI001166C4C4|nr:phage major capsid protein [Methylorubrum extorquens]GEL42250.1 phage capsid protein [Methylorubrum extorquens]